MSQLFKLKGFLPYILIVFLNAFVDLGHKIIIQNTVFKTWDGQTQIILTAIINALILLPFILLFSPSGFLSDKYPKHLIVRYGAMAVAGITCLITFSYYMGWFWAAFGFTLLLAAQSAIYSPAKYGYIRELVGDENLAQANAVVQALTIVSILGGTFVFSALFEWLLPMVYGDASQVIQHVAVLGWILVALSVAEWLMSYRLPQKYAGDRQQRFQIRGYFSGAYLARNLNAIYASKSIWLSIVGLSVFWAISQVILASFPAYAKETFNETNTLVIQGILACTGIGIIIGSVVAGRMSRAYIELGLIPLGVTGIAAGLLLLPLMSNHTLLATVFLLLGFCGGLFIVPLNALIQYSARDNQLGVVLAGNNWIQTLTMLSFLGLTALFAVMGIDSIGLFYLLALVALAGLVYTVKTLPHSLVRLLLSAVMQRRYRIDVVDFDHLPKDGGVLLLGNHISWIDWAILQIASPRPVRFVMLRSIYQRWYLKPLFSAFGAIPISSGNSKESLETVNKALKNGEVVCLFPEGAISRTGHLGLFHTGYQRAVDGVEGVIVPFYLRGLWGSWLSRSSSEKLRSNTRNGLKRDIIVAFGKPLPATTSADMLKQKVFELSVNAWNRHTARLDTLPLAWLKTARKSLLGASLIDSSGQQYSQAKVVAATLRLAGIVRKQSRCTTVGLLLPASPAGIMMNMAVMLNGQAAVNLNYTTSVAAIQSGIVSAGLDTVYTSERFISKLKGRGLDVDAMLAGVRVVCLEDLKDALSTRHLLLPLAVVFLLPAAVIYRLFGKAVAVEAPAQILFSSGSEGTPKGIVLSHRNIIGNIKQISDVLNTRDDDVVMSCLPLFHSFGLTVTSLLPMVEGLPAVCHPDPTDALGIAKAVARYQATVMCGTATFLRLYTVNKKISPLMFESLRVVVAGAEKLTDNVRNAFELKFKKTVFEGYGATETTPVASVNVPDKLDLSSWKVQTGQKPGTVGLPLPGCCFRIVDPQTLQALPNGEDGLVLIAGGQVMLGYLNDADRTAQAIVELDGHRWYKTGDKGHLDADGFLTIVDRYSRFAKIGGEMVSLSVVEQAVRTVLASDELDIAACNLKDEKKGEKIVLLVCGYNESESIRQQLMDAQLNPLQIPSAVIAVDAIPKLGSGKTDFAALKQLAEKLA